MNTFELEKALYEWKSKTGNVAIEPQSVDGRTCYELSWENPRGIKGYIDVYPQQNDVIVVQYGTFDPKRNDRNHVGMTKWRCASDLAMNLTRVRSTVDGFEAELFAETSYSPAPRISSVSSLKLR